MEELISGPVAVLFIDKDIQKLTQMNQQED